MSDLEPHVNGPFSPDLAHKLSDFPAEVAKNDWPVDVKVWWWEFFVGVGVLLIFFFFLFFIPHIFLFSGGVNWELHKQQLSRYDQICRFFLGGVEWGGVRKIFPFGSSFSLLSFYFIFFFFFYFFYFFFFFFRFSEASCRKRIEI